MIRLTDYPLPKDRRSSTGVRNRIPGSAFAWYMGCTCPWQPLASVVWRDTVRSVRVAVADGCPLHGRVAVPPNGKRPDQGRTA